MTSPPSTKQATDCFSGVDAKTMLSVEDALEKLAAAIQPVAETERVPLVEADSRTLANALISPVTLPSTDNAAMDGYAVRLDDLMDGGAGTTNTTLPVSLRIPAGHPADRPLAPGMAARIFTGATIPDGADTVVMQEDTQSVNAGQLVAISGVHRRGDHIRRAGEDVRAGSTVLSAGIRLRAPEIAMAAHVGQAELEVYRRPKVAVFTTGDEVVEPGTKPLPLGALYNANRRNLIAMTAAIGGITLDMGNLPDDPTAIRNALAVASQEADLIVTSGGVSVGEEDHVKGAVSALGALNFWRLRIKPGKPLAFGTVAGVPFMGLPGNPVSTFVTFLLFGRALLLRLSGVAPDRLAPPRYQLPLAEPMTRSVGARREYPRAKLVRGEDGTQQVLLAQAQGSHQVSSMTQADGLVELAETTPALPAGSLVPYLPYAELLR